jgi:hypothetical protein
VAIYGKGALAFWNGIAPDGDAEFLAWHVSEHIPERVGLPGFLRGRRYVAESGFPRYFNFYETDTVDALESSRYKERLNDPTPWTTKVIATFRDTSRTVCTVHHTQGRGEGAWMETIRFGFPADRAACSDAIADLLKSLPERTPLVGAHLLVGIAPKAPANTKELELRGRPDDHIDGVILIESADRAEIGRLAASALSDDALGRLGLHALRRGIYQLQFSLSADALDCSRNQ